MRVDFVSTVSVCTESSLSPSSAFIDCLYRSNAVSLVVSSELWLSRKSAASIKSFSTLSGVISFLDFLSACLFDLHSIQV